MINIGKINTLKVVAEYPFGYALAPLTDNVESTDYSSENMPTVTLPHDEVTTPLEVEQTLDVFVATDQRGDLFATLKPPRIQVGETKAGGSVRGTLPCH